MPSNSPTPQEFAVDVVRKLRDAGHQALWAGGCVRDLVLGVEPKDYDVATTATPEQVRDVFGKRYTVPVGISFGVVLVVGPRSAGQVEVATFRREGEYVDGRRPESVEFCTPEEDAHRRDFTINGMFYDPLEQRVLDYVGGESDLQRGVIRSIGSALDRFNEDKLRMLRAVRFTARFGFELEDATAAAIREHASGLLVVSIERITQELRQMLTHPSRRRAVELALDLEVWPVILPELPLDDDRETTLQMLAELNDPSADTALAVLCRHLSAEAANRLGRKLKLSNEERGELVWLIEHQNDLDDPAGLPLSQFKRMLVEPHFGPLLEFTRVRQLVTANSTAAYDFCRSFLAKTPPERINPDALVTGDDLIQLGMSPGAGFKGLLDAVRDAQLDERIATREEALELVDRLRPPPAADKK